MCILVIKAKEYICQWSKRGFFFSDLFLPRIHFGCSSTKGLGSLYLLFLTDQETIEGAESDLSQLTGQDGLEAT